MASRDWASGDDEARPVDRLAHRLRQVNGQQRNSEAGGNRAEIAQIRVGTRPATMTDYDLGARPAAHRELVTHPGVSERMPTVAQKPMQRSKASRGGHNMSNTVIGGKANRALISLPENAASQRN